MFIDEISVEVVAGRGGNGIVAFRREKFVPKGGPSGGDGGNGGDIVLLARKKLTTLGDLRYRRILKAKRGGDGGAKKMHGKSGGQLLVEVPVGTLVYDSESDELLGDLVEEGSRLVVAKGGRGGRGNVHFATSTQQAPRYAEQGKEGETRSIRLELKLLADIGLLGYPSVGKSTLVSRISNARPKIAAYPFTTLIPNLGVVGFKGYREFVVADIPGLIEGAAEGKGLGHQFLRHVERTGILVHLLEVVPQLDGQEVPREPMRDYEALNDELRRFDEALLSRPQVVVLNKVDLPYVAEEVERLREAFTALGRPFFTISAATGEGLQELINHLGQAVFEGREEW